MLVEFVFCMPLLGAVLALVFFFGWAMNNQQHVKMAARYSLWKDVRGPTAATGIEVNQKFLQRKSDNIVITPSSGWSDAFIAEYRAATAATGRNNDVMTSMVLDQFPHGHRSDVSGHFPTSVGLWEQFEGSIGSGRSRDGVEWRTGQAECNQTIRDNYLTALDAMLTGIPAPGNSLGQMIRQLYMAHWSAAPRAAAR